MARGVDVLSIKSKLFLYTATFILLLFLLLLFLILFHLLPSCPVKNKVQVHHCTAMAAIKETRQPFLAKENNGGK